MRPEIDAHFAPAHVEIRMVILGLCDGCDPVDEVDRLGEVPELVRLDQLLAIFDLPALELRQQRGDLALGQWRRATFAGNAGAIRQAARHETGLAPDLAHRLCRTYEISLPDLVPFFLLPDGSDDKVSDCLVGCAAAEQRFDVMLLDREQARP